MKPAHDGRLLTVTSTFVAVAGRESHKPSPVARVERSVAALAPDAQVDGPDMPTIDDHPVVGASGSDDVSTTQEPVSHNSPDRRTSGALDGDAVHVVDDVVTNLDPGAVGTGARHRRCGFGKRSRSEKDENRDHRERRNAETTTVMRSMSPQHEARLPGAVTPASLFRRLALSGSGR